jgi:hypothetical protein
MFGSVGYFHFGLNHSDPFGSLRTALIEKRRLQRVEGALIVLPEAFNIRKDYWDQESPCVVRPDDLSQTQKVAQDFGVSFVAGLVLAENVGYSSAYFICGGSDPALMCHKTCKDDLGRDDGIPDGMEFNYRTCDADSCDKDNPHTETFEDAKTVIAALICVDAKPPRNRFDPYDTKREPSPQEKRRNRVNQSIEERGGDCQIVCIPACVVNDFSGGQPGMTLAGVY